MSPDRVVVGIESDRARAVMTKLYRPFLTNNFRVYFMDIPSAEMTKYAANAMLATRISFMNDIANRRTHRQEIPLSGMRLWRVLLPQGRESPHKNR